MTAKYYEVQDQHGLIMDVCPTRQCALRSIEILERANMADCIYSDGQYNLVHPNGMIERIYNIWPYRAYEGRTIDDKPIYEGIPA